MEKRYVAIWFRHLVTDWMAIRTPELLQAPFVLVYKEKGRLLIASASKIALTKGIRPGMLLADARAMVSGLRDFEFQSAAAERILTKIAQWCLRFSPAVAMDLPDGIVLDCSGCTHLWSGETAYLQDIFQKLSRFGYSLQCAMASTPAAAWAFARFGPPQTVIPSGKQQLELQQLPPAALRIDAITIQRLQKLGLERIGQFSSMPRSVLRRRFGEQLLHRIDQAYGLQPEPLIFVQQAVPYQERLPCLEPIMSAKGIAIALQRLLDTLCNRLQREGRGLRKAMLRAHRIDGRTVQINITTNHPSNKADHLLQLFGLKIPDLEPGPGVEVFVLQAERVEPVTTIQDGIWRKNSGLRDVAIAELLDRVAGKAGSEVIHRYLPQLQYWPEKSFKITDDIQEERMHDWPQTWRPVHLLPHPLLITVTAPIPDYPPMHFRYQGKLHEVKKADGPERLERAWWVDPGEHRDYYVVEDQDGQRFWIFRLGHYGSQKPATWYVHGFFP